MTFFFSCLASSKWLTEKRVKRIESFSNWFLGNLSKSRHGTEHLLLRCIHYRPENQTVPEIYKKVNPDFQREQNWFHRQKHITVFSASRCALKRLHQYLEQDADSEQYPDPCWVSALGRTNTNNYYSDFIWYPLNGTLLSFSSIVAVMRIWRVGFDF